MAALEPTLLRRKWTSKAQPSSAPEMPSNNIMRTNWLVMLILVSASAAQAADLCNPANLVGPYAFQLTGSTDISGTPRPTTGLGRIVFDGRDSLSGTASACSADYF